MADPVQYESFGMMMFEHAPFIIAGMVGLIGGTMLVLRKLGILVFSSEQNDMNKCDKCGYKNVDSDVLSKSIKAKCDGHQELADNLAAVQIAQNLMLQQQRANMTELSNGKTEFKSIQARIADLRVGVGILLDRTGSIPDQFKDVFKDKR